METGIVPPKNKVLKHTYCLFLDDFRPPSEAYNYTRDTVYLKEEWVCVKDFEEFVKVFNERLANGEIPKIVSFDRDLHPEHYDGLVSFHPTGQDCLLYYIAQLEKYILEELDKVYKPNSAAIMDIKILVHSQNPLSSNMIAVAKLWQEKLRKLLKLE